MIFLNLREAGFFNADNVTQLLKKGLNQQLDRAGTRDNMAFTLILSTMLLYETFVTRRLCFTPDIRSPTKLTLV